MGLETVQGRGQPGDVERLRVVVDLAHLIHRALILAAPGIRKGEPVDRYAERLEDLLGLARNAGAPVNQCSEDIEQQRFGHVGHGITP